MAVAYRNHGVAAIEVSVDFSVLVPKCCIETSYRLDVPKRIYVK
jgi:hypothetical protein